VNTTSLTRDHDVPVSGRRLAVAVAAWMAVSVAVGFGTYAVAKSVAPEWASDAHNVAMVVTFEVYAILVVAMLLIVGGRGRYRSALGLRAVRPEDVLLALGMAVAAVLVSAAAYAILELIAPADPSALDVILGIGADGGRLADASIWATALIIFRILVLVPLGEELLFRGALYAWLRRRLSRWWTIALTSALFAMIHQIPIIFPIAFLWGAARPGPRQRPG